MCSDTWVTSLAVFKRCPQKAKRVEIINKLICSKIVSLTDSCKPKDRVGIVRGILCWAYLDYHHTLDTADLFLTDSEVERFRMSAHTFLMSLQELVRLDVPWIWKIRPKHHQLDHMIIGFVKFSKLNPKRISCLLQEDFMGQMKKIGLSCRGLKPIAMAGRLIDRYMLSISVRWHEHNGR